MPGRVSSLLRESAYFAFGLLQRGGARDVAAAARILDLVISRQNSDSLSEFWGSFTCEYEQTWETWEFPDKNWAQFMGVIFAHILNRPDLVGRLPVKVVERLRASFLTTVAATLRRDVDPAYSNIAFLSAALAAAGARLCNERGAERFAYRKLREVSRRASSGIVDEYLSPTYYGTSFYALYSTAMFSPSLRVEREAVTLQDLLWEDVNQSFHPATGQLAGPHSRAYGDDMRDYAAKLKYFIYLATGGRYPIPSEEVHHAHDCSSLSIISTFDVPRISGLGRVPPGYRHVTLPRHQGIRPTLHQHREASFVFGTVSEQDEWSQRRNLIAYWQHQRKTLVCKGYADEESGKGGRFFAAQEGSSALVVVRLPSAHEASSYTLAFNAPLASPAVVTADGIGLHLPGRKISLFSVDSGGEGVLIQPAIETSRSETRITWRGGAGRRFVAFVLEFSQTSGWKTKLSVSNHGALSVIASNQKSRLKLKVNSI